MSYTISPERYEYISKLDPAVAEATLARLELTTATGITEAYHAMTKKIKIDTALDAFGSGNISNYTSELGDTGLKFTSRDITSATIDAQKTQRALDNFDTVPLPLKGQGGWHILKSKKRPELTFEELNKQIEVNTGIELETQDSKKQYKKAITKVLSNLKDKLPALLYIRYSFYLTKKATYGSF